MSKRKNFDKEKNPRRKANRGRAKAERYFSRLDEFDAFAPNVMFNFHEPKKNEKK